jgi:hypothetical protein
LLFAAAAADTPRHIFALSLAPISSAMPFRSHAAIDFRYYADFADIAFFRFIIDDFDDFSCQMIDAITPDSCFSVGLIFMPPCRFSPPPRRFSYAISLPFSLSPHYIAVFAVFSHYAFAAFLYFRHFTFSRFFQFDTPIFAMPFSAAIIFASPVSLMIISFTMPPPSFRLHYFSPRRH